MELNFFKGSFLGSFLTGILIFIITLFIAPWVSFWICYFEGWIAAKVIGVELVRGLAIFGITIPISQIPLFAGILGWIGGFFKNFSSEYKNKLK